MRLYFYSITNKIITEQFIKIKTFSSNNKPKINWLNTTVLLLTPLIAAILVPLYWIYTGFTWADWMFFGLFMIFTGVGITGGYHRLWSHKAYNAHPIVKIFYAYWGACAGQNSILLWSADHRRHHRHIDDTTQDPYCAKKGFWYSHIGWILTDEPKDESYLDNVKDLTKDRIVMFQHKYYLLIVLFSNFAVPVLLGYTAYSLTGSGGIWGALILAGFFRFVLNHHFTFLINSACHFFGSQPYSNKDTSRDNFFLALFTYGEGYHNFHHTFQADYRNGIRWYHFDPTKWLIKSLNYFGLTSNLKKVSNPIIEKQMLLHSVNKHKDKLFASKNQETQIKIEHLYSDFVESLNNWMKTSQEYFRYLKVHKISALEKKEWLLKIEGLKSLVESKRGLLIGEYHGVKAIYP